VAEPEGPEDAGRSRRAVSGAADEELDRRRRDLEAALASRRPLAVDGRDAPSSGGMAGFGNALRLSSEFVAAIVVGAGIGWFLDRFAGTSPWGLILFLILGFAAGVLNVLRSAGMVAEVGAGPKIRDSRDENGK